MFPLLKERQQEVFIETELSREEILALKKSGLYILL